MPARIRNRTAVGWTIGLARLTLTQYELSVAVYRSSVLLIVLRTECSREAFHKALHCYLLEFILFTTFGRASKDHSVSIEIPGASLCAAV